MLAGVVELAEGEQFALHRGGGLLLVLRVVPCNSVHHITDATAKWHHTYEGSVLVEVPHEVVIIAELVEGGKRRGGVGTQQRR